METYKCAFSGALIGKQYGCQYALEVTRRDGPAVACTSDVMHPKCAALLEGFKAAALPHLGYIDDLSQMPHSVLMKIQSGGLAALQKHLQGADSLADVKNAAAVITEAEQRYGNVTSVPYALFVNDIAEYKFRRRR